MNSVQTTVIFASFWIRFAAHLIDFILLNAFEFAVEYALQGLVFLVRKFLLHETVTFSDSVHPLLEQGFEIIFGLMITYYYYVPYQLKKATTIGKKLFSLYVVNADDGKPMTHAQAVKRMLSYGLSYLIAGCGFLMAAFHPEKRALHDLIAGTVVIRRARTK